MRLIPLGVVGEFGVWRPLHPSAREQFKAIFNCPFCKKDMTLHGYNIDHKGYVNPSVMCLTEGCTFNEDIHLLGWERQLKRKQ